MQFSDAGLDPHTPETRIYRNAVPPSNHAQVPPYDFHEPHEQVGSEPNSTIEGNQTVDPMPVRSMQEYSRVVERMMMMGKEDVES